MTTLQLTIICTTFLMLAILAVAALTTRPELVEDAEPDAPAWPPAGATVVVHMVDERSVRGIVVEGARARRA
jgi:hypothetical protein